MYLDGISLFANLSEEQKEYFSHFFQNISIEKGNFLFQIGDEITGLYFLLSGQLLISNSDGKGIGFINQNALIGSSIIFDYSNKNKQIKVNLEAYNTCNFLFLPGDIIRHLTDKDRNIFKKIIEQIKQEKRIL